ITGNPGTGEADKILSLTNCDGLTLNSVQFKRGGHFAILTNHCNNITSDHLRIATAGDRDGWNVISATNVTISNASIAANDDALVFKSDYALGAKLPHGNVTGTGSYSPTIWGEAGSNQISDVHFTNVRLTVPGGNGTMNTAVPSNDPNNYNPNSIGTRPAYGWYVHNAHDITWASSSVDFNTADGRPAVIANTGANLSFDGLTAERTSTGPYDVGFQSVVGYCVKNSQNTAGGSLRVSADSGSSQKCTTGVDYQAENCTIFHGTVDTNHLGYTGTGFVNDTNEIGSYIECAVTVAAT